MAPGCTDTFHRAASSSPVWSTSLSKGFIRPGHRPSAKDGAAATFVWPSVGCGSSVDRCGAGATASAGLGAAGSGAARNGAAGGGVASDDGSAAPVMTVVDHSRHAALAIPDRRGTRAPPSAGPGRPSTTRRTPRTSHSRHVAAPSAVSSSVPSGRWTVAVSAPRTRMRPSASSPLHQSPQTSARSGKALMPTDVSTSRNASRLSPVSTAGQRRTARSPSAGALIRIAVRRPTTAVRSPGRYPDP